MLGYNAVPPELNESRSIPSDFKVTHAHEFRARRGEKNLLETHGWSVEAPAGREKFRDSDELLPGQPRVVYDAPRVDFRQSPVDADVRLRRRTLGWGEVNGPFVVCEHDVVTNHRAAERIEPLGRVDWADWDNDGSLLFAKEGVLYRRRLGERDPRELADFRDDRFARIPPTPIARRWP